MRPDTKKESRNIKRDTFFNSNPQLKPFLNLCDLATIMTQIIEAKYISMVEYQTKLTQTNKRNKKVLRLKCKFSISLNYRKKYFLM